MTLQAPVAYDPKSIDKSGGDQTFETMKSIQSSDTRKFIAVLVQRVQALESSRHGGNKPGSLGRVP